jgi:polar amino acid transport system substrate-binding protein
VGFVGYDAAGRVFDAAKTDAWDIAFLAVDPKRAEDIVFTAPYVVIEGTYLVARDARFAAVGDVDQPGVRVAVGQGSAYDLYLSRALHHATIVRAPTSPAAIDLYVADRLDAAAGVKNPLVAYADAHPAYRVLPGRFMAIGQAVGMPKGRGEAGARYLRAFVEDVKASGFVAETIKASGQADAIVAPAASAK